MPVFPGKGLSIFGILIEKGCGYSCMSVMKWSDDSKLSISWK